MAVRQGTVENLVSGTGGGIGDTNLSPVPPIKKEIKRKQIYADTAIQELLPCSLYGCFVQVDCGEISGTVYSKNFFEKPIDITE